MTQMNQVYHCTICGNVVEVLHTGKGTLVCCGQPMVLLEERTEKEEYKEKHVPVASRVGDGLKVAVGSVPHPMKDDHYIEWVEVIEDGNVCRRVLKPGDAPETEFAGAPAAGVVRAYCNIHGLWRGEV